MLCFPRWHIRCSETAVIMASSLKTSIKSVLTEWVTTHWAPKVNAVRRFDRAPGDDGALPEAAATVISTRPKAPVRHLRFMVNDEGMLVPVPLPLPKRPAAPELRGWPGARKTSKPKPPARS